MSLNISTHDCTSSAVTCTAARILSAGCCTACSSVRSVLSFGQQIRPVRGVQQVNSVGNVVARRLGALELPSSVESPPQVDGATNATQGVHDDVHSLHAYERARMPHYGSSGQLWDGSAASSCSRQRSKACSMHACLARRAPCMRV